MIKINDPIWHPCNMDIIEHKVISIRQFEGFNHYILKSKNAIGACGILEVIIDEHKGNLRFIELIDEENIEWSSGLQNFIEGNYYIDFNKAKLEFYKQQETIAWSNREQKKRLYDESEKRYKQIQLLVKELKKLI